MADELQPHRRELITGAAVARVVQRSAAAAIDAFREEVDRQLPPPAMPLVTYGRRAMACQFELRIPANEADQAAEAALAALDRIDELEQLLSVYRPDSGISQLNRAARRGPTEVPPEIATLLDFAAELWRESHGAYDITSGPLSQVWGFARREGRIPTADELDRARQRVGWNQVQWNEETRELTFTHPEVELNFNSSGKGFALDAAANLLREQSAQNFLFHGGRSSLLASGDNPALTDGGWQVALTHPLRPQQRLATFTLHNQGFSTSGSGSQYFYHRGRRYGHLIDPRTGQPVESAYSVSVLAPTAMQADALSTAFFVMGAQASAAYCEKHAEIAAFFVVPAGADAECVPINLQSSQFLLADHAV